MRKNKGNVRRDKTGRSATYPVAVASAYTAEQREKVRCGLRILARIIARAHLRQQATGVKRCQEPPMEKVQGRLPMARRPDGRLWSEQSAESKNRLTGAPRFLRQH